MPQILTADTAASSDAEPNENPDDDETVAAALIANNKDGGGEKGILTVNFVQDQYLDDIVSVMQNNTDNSDSGSDECVFQAVRQQQQPIVPAAQTNETNAVMPIMSTLEHPTKSDRLSPHSSLELGGQNLDESLAVIGVTAHTNIPTSLELPITITNPAIAPKSTANPISLSPIYALANGSVIGLTSSSTASSPLVTSVSDADHLDYDFFNTALPSSQQLLNEGVNESNSNNSMSPNSMDLIDSNSDIVPVTPESMNHRHSPEIRGFPPATDDDTNSSGEIPLQSNLIIRHYQHQQQHHQQHQQSHSELQSNYQLHQQHGAVHRNNHFILADDDSEVDDNDDNDDDGNNDNDGNNRNFINDHHHQYIPSIDEPAPLGNATFSNTYNR